MKTYSPEFVDFLKVVTTEPFFVLDTETTGLDSGEIIQLALIDHKGSTLINTFVKPTSPIPLDATRIHGIDTETANEGREWWDVRQEFIATTRHKNVIIYNATYDRKMMHLTDESHNFDKLDYKTYANYHCAMLAYAEYRGEWNDYRQSYRWQKLSDAARQMHLAVENAHDALGDCLMTLGIVNVMKVLARTNYRHPANIDPDDLGLST